MGYGQRSGNRQRSGSRSRENRISGILKSNCPGCTNYRRRMSVNDGIHVGAHPKDFGVHESFRVQRAAFRIDRHPVQVAVPPENPPVAQKVFRTPIMRRLDPPERRSYTYGTPFKTSSAACGRNQT